MRRRPVVIALCGVVLAGCVTRHVPMMFTSPVCFVGLATFGPPPIHCTPAQPIPLPPPPAVALEIPSLATRALALKVSEAAQRGDCATANSAGVELERMDHDLHHTLLAIDGDYARCFAGI
jgi:hypothetical protein